MRSRGSNLSKVRRCGSKNFVRSMLELVLIQGSLWTPGSCLPAQMSEELTPKPAKLRQGAKQGANEE